jgi:hypothetical protein
LSAEFRHRPIRQTLLLTRELPAATQESGRDPAPLTSAAAAAIYAFVN